MEAETASLVTASFSVLKNQPKHLQTVNRNKSKLLIHFKRQLILVKSNEKTILLCLKLVHYLKRI